MSILTERGKDLKSLRDAPIHLTGFSSVIAPQRGHLHTSIRILLYRGQGFNTRRRWSKTCGQKSWDGSGGGFGTEDALEAGAGELDADQALAGLLRIGDMDDATAGGEVLLHSPRGVA